MAEIPPPVTMQNLAVGVVLVQAMGQSDMREVLLFSVLVVEEVVQAGQVAALRLDEVVFGVHIPQAVAQLV